jgi:hypothetical protein
MLPLSSSVSPLMQDSWQFVAMEYYALILNRSYLVSVDEASIRGKVCRGLTAVEAGRGLTRFISHRLAVHGELNDPTSYVSGLQLARENKADSLYRCVDIVDVDFNPTKKWGMGPYPHDGRVTISTLEQRRELIILGDQSGLKIAERISGIVERANSSLKRTDQSLRD